MLVGSSHEGRESKVEGMSPILSVMRVSLYLFWEVIEIIPVSDDFKAVSAMSGGD